MITIEDFSKVRFELVHPTDAFFKIEKLVLAVLKERDEALQSLRDAKAKAEAYRALACQAEYRWEMSEGDASKTIKNIRRSIDAEAVRILERRFWEGK